MFDFVAVRNGARVEFARVRAGSNRVMLRLEIAWRAVQIRGRVHAASEPAQWKAGRAMQNPTSSQKSRRGVIPQAPLTGDLDGPDWGSTKGRAAR
jgi:hypothetical protein